MSGFDFQLILREGLGLSILKKECGKDATRKLVHVELNRIQKLVSQNERKTFEKLQDWQVVEKIIAEAHDPFVLALSLHEFNMKN